MSPDASSGGAMGERAGARRQPVAGTLTWPVLTLSGAVCAAGIAVLPWPYRGLLWAVAAIICVGVFLRGLVRVGPALPAPWRLLAAGFTMRLLADVAWTVERVVYGRDMPFPSYN